MPKRVAQVEGTAPVTDGRAKASENAGLELPCMERCGYLLFPRDLQGIAIRALGEASQLGSIS